MDMHWLNEWHKEKGKDYILIGTVIRCIGCGRYLGITCVVPSEPWKHQNKEPVWPFAQNDCPVCTKELRGLRPEDVAKCPLSVIRRAVELVKAKRKNRD